MNKEVFEIFADEACTKWDNFFFILTLAMIIGFSAFAYFSLEKVVMAKELRRVEVIPSPELPTAIGGLLCLRFYNGRGELVSGQCLK